MSKSELKRAILAGVYILLIVINLTAIVPQLGSFGLGILRSWQQDGLWRSARFAYSANFADYIQFLREEIPPDALVVIPPEEVSTWALSDTPTMQFFLAPRQIHNCATQACAARFLADPDTYVLIMGLDRFPGQEIGSQADKISMHNDTWGVYGPAEGLGQGQQIPGGPGDGGIIRGVILPLLWLLLMVGMGYLLGTGLMANFPGWIRLTGGMGLLLGGYSIFGYLILLLGLSSSLAAILIGLIAISAILLGIAFKLNWVSFADLGSLFSNRSGFDWWAIALALVGLGLAFLSAGTGFHETDSIVLWGAKAQGLITEGLPGMASWGTNTTYYPLHVPLLLGMTMDAFGLGLPAAKLIFPLFYLGLNLSAYGYFKKQFKPHLAGLSTLALATLPLLIQHGMVGYANLPLTFYLVSGVIISQEVSNNNSSGKTWLLSGLLFSLAVWCRPEGFWLVLGVGAVMLVQDLILSGREIFSGALRILIPPLAIYLLWILTRGSYYSEVNAVENNLNQVLQAFGSGSYHFQDLAGIMFHLLKSLLDPQRWAAVGVGLAVVVWLVVRRAYKADPATGLFLSAGLVIIVLISMIYYVFSFTGTYDISWWLNTGYDRMVMPGFILLWLGISQQINLAATAEAAAGE